MTILSLFKRQKATSSIETSNHEVKEGAISFHDFDIQPGRIDCIYKASNVDDSNHVWFEFNDSITPSTDAIACALASLCGKRYETISIELPIHDEVNRRLEDFYRIDNRDIRFCIFEPGKPEEEA